MHRNVNSVYTTKSIFTKAIQWIRLWKISISLIKFTFPFIPKSFVRIEFNQFQKGKKLLFFWNDLRSEINQTILSVKCARFTFLAIEMDIFKKGALQLL